MKYLAALQDRSADFKFRTDLGGFLYTVRFQWNIRCQSWFLTIEDSIGGRIDGVKVVEKWPLLASHRAQIRLTGDLVAIPLTTDKNVRLDYDTLGTEWVVAYMTPDELDLWRSTNGMG